MSTYTYKPTPMTPKELAAEVLGAGVLSLTGQPTITRRPGPDGQLITVVDFPGVSLTPDQIGALSGIAADAMWGSLQ